jgi:hypothetical protein
MISDPERLAHNIDIYTGALSAAYVCPQNRHTPTHVFLKIRIPIPPLANPRSALLPVFYPGGKGDIGPLRIPVLRQLQRETHCMSPGFKGMLLHQCGL